LTRSSNEEGGRQASLCIAVFFLRSRRAGTERSFGGVTK
jgi:hypothetical protein